MITLQAVFSNCYCLSAGRPGALRDNDIIHPVDMPPGPGPEGLDRDECILPGGRSAPRAPRDERWFEDQPWH